MINYSQFTPGQFVYNTVLISSTQPWVVDRQGLPFIYAFTPLAMVVTTTEYGGVILAQNQLNFITFPDTTKVLAPTYPTGVYIITVATDEKLFDAVPRTGLNAYERSGQAYSASTGWQRVGTVNNFVALQLIGNSSQKNIQIVRATASTELTTPPRVFLSQANNNIILSGMGSAFDPIANIANHRIDLSFASGINFLPTAQIYDSVGGTGITGLSGITGLTEAVPAGTIDLLQGTTRIIQKGMPGTLVAAIMMPDTTHFASISFDWYEEY